MMKPRIHIFFTLTFYISMLAFPPQVDAQTIDNRILADDIAEHLALNHQLDTLPDDIRVQFEQNPFQLPPEENKHLLEAFKKAYNDSLLLHDFKSALAPALSPEYAREIRTWLSTENTQHITDIRQEFYTLQGKRKRVIAMYEMEQNPPTQDRVSLIKTLTDTTSVTESTIESSVTILRSVIEAVSALSKEQSFTEPQIDAITSNFRAQIQGQISQEYKNQMLILFQPVDSGKLKDYIRFWGTNAGQWLDQRISQSIHESYESASERLQESISNNN